MFVASFRPLWDWGKPGIQAYEVTLFQEFEMQDPAKASTFTLT
jgi:hypothetical protein